MSIKEICLYIENLPKEVDDKLSRLARIVNLDVEGLYGHFLQFKAIAKINELCEQYEIPAEVANLYYE